MRSPLDVIAGWLTRDRDRAELDAAQAERDAARTRAQEDDRLTRDALDLAARLRTHREENHFAQRMNAAFAQKRRHP